MYSLPHGSIMMFKGVIEVMCLRPNIDGLMSGCQYVQMYWQVVLVHQYDFPNKECSHSLHYVLNVYHDLRLSYNFSITHTLLTK